MLRLDYMESSKYVFLKSWNFSTLRETGVTDNASNMVRMGRLVDILHIPCNSHNKNLLSKSIVDNEFATQMNKLLKNFKHTALEALLLERGGNRIVLIGDTRWCSHRDAFRRCLRNINSMREVSQLQQLQERNLITQTSYQLLNDPELEAKLIDNTLLLDPICELTNSCQRADCTIADATEMFNLQVPVVANHEMENIFDERKKKAICTYGLAANLLHKNLPKIKIT